MPSTWHRHVLQQHLIDRPAGGVGPKLLGGAALRREALDGHRLAAPAGLTAVAEVELTRAGAAPTPRPSLMAELRERQRQLGIYAQETGATDEEAAAGEAEAWSEAETLVGALNALAAGLAWVPGLGSPAPRADRARAILLRREAGVLDRLRRDAVYRAAWAGQGWDAARAAAAFRGVQCLDSSRRMT